MSTMIDDNHLDTEVEVTAQDAFMAGRGITRVKFDADEEVLVTTSPETGEQIEVGRRMVNERVLYENVSWRDYREGPATRWDSVPWVAFRHKISKEERDRLQSDEIAAVYAKDKAPADAQEEEKDCDLWEIWCKQSQKVYFVLQDSGKVLDVKPDPLGLTGFFPNPQPIQPVTGSGKRTPTCPYTIYKTLAEELDTATKRIGKIMKGLRVRGVIAGDAEVMDVLAEADDNELVPVANIENLVAAGGLEKAVMWWPVDKAIAVLAQLYGQREQVKQAIYEITGISDIVRGASNSGETATAQQIKTEWGSLRIRKMQRGIERHARDLFVLTAEIMGQHFSPETMSKLAGMEIGPEAAMALSAPLDHYRIDIETDSTVRADLTKSRTEMSEFLQGTAQFFSAMAPVVGAAPEAAGPLAKMYAAFARQFNLGKDAEDALDQFMQMAEQAAQKSSGPSPEQMKAEQEAKMADREMGLKERQLQFDQLAKRADLALERDNLGLEESKAELGAIIDLLKLEKADMRGAA